MDYYTLIGGLIFLCVLAVGAWVVYESRRDSF